MLTYDTVQKNGCLIGLPYTVFNGQSTIPDDASDGIISLSGQANFVEGYGNIPA
jgi:hypothetical protein